MKNHYVIVQLPDRCISIYNGAQNNLIGYFCMYYIKLEISKTIFIIFSDDLGALKSHVMKMAMKQLMSKGKKEKQHSEL